METLFYQCLPVTELLDKMGRYPVFFQLCHEQIAHFIINNSLTGNGTLFQAVKCGGIILIIHNQPFRVICPVNLLCFFSFIQLFFFFRFS